MARRPGAPSAHQQHCCAGWVLEPQHRDQRCEVSSLGISKTIRDTLGIPAGARLSERVLMGPPTSARMGPWGSTVLLL